MSRAPANIKQVYVRGDTDPIQFRLTDSDGNPIDITSYTFRLSVDSVENPLDATRPTATEIFAVDGTITDAAAGRFEFVITTVMSDQTPGTYYYDVERTNGTKSRTIVKSTFQIMQDITKPVP